MLLITVCYMDGNAQFTAAAADASKHSKLEHLVLVVAQLRQDPSQVSLVLGTLFCAADGLVKTRRSTDEQLWVA
jgi:hypothetical protein